MASSCHGEQHTGSAAVAAERRGSGGSSSGGSSSGSSSGGSSSEGPSLAAEECGGGFVDLLVRLLPAALVSCCHLRRESCVRCSVHVKQRRHWHGSTGTAAFAVGRGPGSAASHAMANRQSANRFSHRLISSRQSTHAESRASEPVTPWPVDPPDQGLQHSCNAATARRPSPTHPVPPPAGQPARRRTGGQGASMRAPAQVAEKQAKGGE
jgi:hypothetical protein